MKRQRYHFADKRLYSQSYWFSSSHVQMWKLDRKEGWVPNNWCFWRVVLEKTLQSPLDCKEIQPINPNENQPWKFIGRTDAKAQTPMFWPHDAKSQLVGQILMLEKIEGRRRGWQRMRQLDGIIDSMDMNLNKLGETDLVKEREACCAAVHGVAKSGTWVSDWTINLANIS